MNTDSSLDISARAMEAQSTRLRIIAENLANQDSTAATPDQEPYRRKTVIFGSDLDRATGASFVSIKRVDRDRTPFPLKFDPSNPAADTSGYVRTPNVNSFVEVMDMREAERSYSANLTMMQTTRGMWLRALDMLK